MSRGKKQITILTMIAAFFILISSIDLFFAFHNPIIIISIFGFIASIAFVGANFWYVPGMKKMLERKKIKMDQQIAELKEHFNIGEHDMADYIKAKLEKSPGELQDFEFLLEQLNLLDLTIRAYRDILCIVPKNFQEVHPHHRLFFVTDKHNPRQWKSIFPKCLDKEISPIIPTSHGVLRENLSSHYIANLFSERIFLLSRNEKEDTTLRFFISRNFSDQNEFETYYKEQKEEQTVPNLHNLHNFHCHFETFVQENPDTKDTPKEWLKHLYQV